MKKHIVRLSTEERKTLTKLITSGRGPARMFTRGRILLKADQSDNGPGWPDERINDFISILPSNLAVGLFWMLFQALVAMYA